MGKFGVYVQIYNYMKYIYGQRSIITCIHRDLCRYFEIYIYVHQSLFLFLTNTTKFPFPFAPFVIFLSFVLPQPVKIPDPDDPSKRIVDYWGPSQKMLSDPNFITSLKKYDKDNINPKFIKEIQTRFMPNEGFTPKAAEKASKGEGGGSFFSFLKTFDNFFQ